MPVDNDENDVSVYFSRVRQTMLSSRRTAANLTDFTDQSLQHTSCLPTFDFVAGNESAYMVTAERRRNINISRRSCFGILPLLQQQAPLTDFL